MKSYALLWATIVLALLFVLWLASTQDWSV